ncbi:kinesin [Thraustotheca clavata]|uniref:Kinesin n=1 Tax=Thraustotheca clavata TaxID=74557 RepID=A0A1W0A9C2_9STRA|nr:kinesin [Thraustotheca clavata]
MKSRQELDEEKALQLRKEKFRVAQGKTVEGGIENSFQARFPALDSSFWKVFYEACASGRQWVNQRSLLISYSLPQTINSKDIFGETMMTLAAQHGRVPVLTVLLGIKGDPWCTNQKGWSAVTIAALQNHVHVLQLFASNNIRLDLPDNRLGYTPAHFVVQVHNASILRLLHELRADLTIPAKNACGYTLLHTAAEVAADECLIYLLKKKLIPIDSRDTNGESACCKAARHNHNSTLQILLDHGASFSLENTQRDTVADRNILKGHLNKFVMDHTVVTDYTRVSECENVKVYVRARPCADASEPFDGMFERKKDTPKNIAIKTNLNMVNMHLALTMLIFWTQTTQEEVFVSTSKPLVEYALRGINSCCFAYGQTGSGKTFSLRHSLIKTSIFGESGEKDGIIPRCTDFLFDTIERNQYIDHSNKPEITLVVSFLEIYCDRLRDLGREYVQKTGRLVSSQQSSTADWYLKQKAVKHTDSSVSLLSSHSAKDEVKFDYERENLEIHEDAQGQVFVKDLSMIEVTRREEVNVIVQMGLKLRSTHETKMNAVSSRSHTVFSIHVFQHDPTTNEVISGTLNLVDLAGSERLKKSESDGQRLKEALHINSSLSAVGKVVMSLDPESRFNYIPYRDSKLTRLLQNSIGGNSFTILIATIHPMKEHYEECLSTLQFANRCRTVQNQPRVNYINQSVIEKDRRIRKLQDEIAILKRKLEVFKSEQNQRMGTILRELGYEVSGFTEEGNVRLTDGTLVIATEETILDLQGNPITLTIKNEPATSPTKRRASHSDHGRNLELRRTIGNLILLEFLRKERDYLRQKADDVKGAVVQAQVELKKEKDEMLRQLQAQKRHVARLEAELVQKDEALVRIQAQGESKHLKDIQHILQHNQALQRPIAQPPCVIVAKTTSTYTLPEDFTHRAFMLEKSKEGDIALVKEHYECLLNRKKQELVDLTKQWNEQQEQSKTINETLKQEMTELYQYTTRLYQASQLHIERKDVQWPKPILTNMTKLRYFRSLLGSDAIVQTQRAKQPIKRSVSRPVSAPARRPSSAGYALAFRGRVQSQEEHQQDKPEIDDELDTLRAQLQREMQKNRELRAINASLQRQSNKYKH